MKKQLLITTCVLSFSTMLFAQTDNELLGTGAGANITTGDRNVFLGDRAGATLTTGFDNVFVGTEAGFNNTADDNTFIGTEAGELNTTGVDNTFVGEEAGTDNTTGSDNTFIGEDAGTNNTTADKNTFVGSRAGNNNTEGFRNVYVGNDAGFDSSTGFKNTIVGDSTGIDNSTGRLNTFIGAGAGAATEFANYNTFVGAHSGGRNNITNGQSSDGNRNTYLGIFSGYNNRAGQDNVGVGAFADYAQGYELNNTFGTSDAVTNATDFSQTTFIGAQTFANNNSVTLVGFRAAASGVAGVAIGGFTEANGVVSIALGADSKTEGEVSIVLGYKSIVNGDGSVAIGREIVINQQQTMALGGDTNVNRLSVGIGTVSANGNASLELADIDKGLLLNRLTTAQRTAMQTAAADGTALNSQEEGLLVYDTTLDSMFTWNGSAWDGVGVDTDEQQLSLASNVLSISGSTPTVDLSQYVNTDSQALSFSSNTLSLSGSTQTIDLSGYVSTDDQNLASATLAATNILTIEIEGGTAVTVDLNPLITDLEAANNNQQIQINDLITRVTTLEGCACDTLAVNGVDDVANRSAAPILYQNIPNPFNGTTSIKYFIPSHYKKGTIVFSNTAGQVIDRVSLKEIGEQQLHFNSDSLQAGMYYYSLFVDGRKFDTKKMIIK